MFNVSFLFILFTCMFTCIAGSVPFLCVLKLRNSCALLLLFATDTQTEREREKERFALESWCV